MQNTTKKTILRFAGFFRKYSVSAGVLMFIIVAASVTHNISPLFYKQFFDILTQADARNQAVGMQLISVLGFVALAEMLNWSLWRAATFCSIYLETKISFDANTECFEKLHHHSFSFFNNNFVGSLVKRVNRFVGAITSVLDQIIWTLLPLLVNVVTIIYILSRRSLVLALIVLVWTFAFLFLNWFLTRFKLKYDIAYGEADSKVSGHFSDTISNNSTIKLFNGLFSEIKTFRSLLQKTQFLQKKRWTLDAFFEALQGFLVIVLEIGIMYVAVRLWQKSILTTGDFALIQAYIISLVNEIWGFGRTLRRLSESLADASEMTTLLETPYEITDAPDAKNLLVQRGAIDFSGVEFSYQTKRAIFSNLNLSIPAGEKVAFVGPSGSGKSTIVKLLLRMYGLKNGTIAIDGQPINLCTQESLWKNISLVPQEPVLFHRTIMENIRYGKPDATDEEVYAAAKSAHCHEFIQRLPEGYATIAGERGLKLSGGERQRISIARAILRNAPILILDEATSSLDSESERYIQDALTHVMPGKTVIVIAHRLSTIMQMDRIVVLKHGVLAEQGTHEQLLAKKGVYSELWSLQTGGVLE